MFDTNENRVRAEMLDLQHGSTFLNNPKIEASCNLKVIKNSRVCVLTVGESPTEPDSDMCALAKKNTEMIRSIVPFIFKYSPHTILLVVTSPVEAMTYACAQLADVPKHKIIGTGCNLDSTRLRFFMSQKYKVAGDSCKGWIVGESGSHSVVLWSTLTVGGVRLCSVNPLIGTNCDPENWTCIHQQVINADYELINLKGCVSWAVAGNAVDIIDSILNNTRKVFSVSVAAQSYYGICHNVYVSLPCVLGEGGVSEILTLPITDNEHEELLCAVAVIRKMQKSTCL
ncbi:hypothetical protein RN001_014883 [Aquatica leii]|uniref:Uncharacterized protein n=1 Tax=Aquatica leii TaxID=1421715 RepID=A0AAN7PNY6_9COLE|nr:hypothetical protein RN001_014883 [Aquatica leii]